MNVGAVLYAKNVPALREFYQNLLALSSDAVRVATDHVALNLPSFQLVLVEVPPQIAASIIIKNPPIARSDVPVKLAFAVKSIAESRAVAARFGGEVWAEQREWDFDGVRVCDARDPEGNIIQLRETKH